MKKVPKPEATWYRPYVSEAVEQDYGFDVVSYSRLAERGLLDPDDHVELLEGVIVCSPSQSPLHASVIMCVDAALRRAVGDRASIRTQMPLLAGPRSAPEPDIALVPGAPVEYRDKHPGTALLVVEVSDSSLPQDRLTKSRIYARAGVLEYWIVNLRDRRVEVHVRPDAEKRLYAAVCIAEAGDSIELAAFPGTRIRVAELFPGY
jgi:Uma2 family endonuclease